MSVNNIHSLINGRWFIHTPYGHSLLPSLFSILNGNKIDVPNDKKDSNTFHYAMSRSISANSQLSSSSIKEDYVAIINLKDPIYKYNQECGPSGTKTKMRIMANYENDPNCVGIVLDVDSGGGQVSGTPEFYDFIKGYSKPVVTYTDGLMCSAAYYIGSAADFIIANNRADAIGSIGVMVSFVDLTGYYEKLGASVITEYSTLSPEKNQAYEELIKGKPELYIKTELDPIAEKFIEDIKAVRTSIDKSVFKGGTWDAPESLSKGLIDSIGTLQDAVDKAFELSSPKQNSNKNKSNFKTKHMSKTTKNFALIQAIVGVTGEGFGTISTITGKKGIQISEEQLDKIEATLSGHNEAIKKEKDAAAAANAKVTAVETAISGAIEAAGLSSAVGADATSASKIELLGSKVSEYGKRSGAIPKTPKAEGDYFEAKDDVVNASDAHNELYNKA